MSAGQDPVAIARMMQTDEVRRKLQMDQMRRRLNPGDSEEKRLKDSCDGFEAIFLNKLWQEMRKTVGKNGYLHSNEEEAYVGMFDQELSSKMAQAGGMGLGQQLYEQLRERLTEAGSITPGIARRYSPGELKPLRPDPAALPLRPEPTALNQPARPVTEIPGQAMALADNLARRIVEDHGAADAGAVSADSLSTASLDALLADDEGFLDAPPDGDAR